MFNKRRYNRVIPAESAVLASTIVTWETRLTLPPVHIATDTVRSLIADIVVPDQCRDRCRCRSHRRQSNRRHGRAATVAATTARVVALDTIDSIATTTTAGRAKTQRSRRPVVTVFVRTAPGVTSAVGRAEHGSPCTSTDSESAASSVLLLLGHLDFLLAPPSGNGGIPLASAYDAGASHPTVDIFVRVERTSQTSFFLLIPFFATTCTCPLDCTLTFLAQRDGLNPLPSTGPD